MMITTIEQLRNICLDEGVSPSVLLEDVGYLEGILKSSMVSEELLRGTIRMYKDGFIQTNQVHNPSEDADTCGHDQWMALQN
jgi:hypothetical protein